MPVHCMRPHWIFGDRKNKNYINLISINSLESQSGAQPKVYARKSLCWEFPAFYSRKGPSINFLGPEQRLFPGGSRAGYPARKVYVYVVLFSSEKII